MVAIAVKPYIFKNALLQISDGETDLGTFERAISEAILSPSVDTVVWRGAVPDSVFKDTTSPDWTFGIKLAQDHSTTGSLSSVLHANAGKVLTFALTANVPDADFKAATFDAVAVPGNYGGTVGSVAEDTVTMPVQGQPVIA